MTLSTTTTTTRRLLRDVVLVGAATFALVAVVLIACLLPEYQDFGFIDYQWLISEGPYPAVIIPTLTVAGYLIGRVFRIRFLWAFLVVLGVWMAHSTLGIMILNGLSPIKGQPDVLMVPRHLWKWAILLLPQTASALIAVLFAVKIGRSKAD